VNVAFVHRRFTEHGGTERFLVGLARHMLGQGHVVHVYSNEVRPDLRGLPVSFHHLPMVKLGQAAKVLSLWRASASIRGRHDLVMGFGRTTGHDLFRAGGGAHQAFLEACRPGWERSPFARLEVQLDRRAVLSAQAVVTPSRASAEDLKRCYGLPEERLRVIHNGVDSERFRPDESLRRQVREELGLEGPVLGFLGTGFARKGLERAAEVASTLRLPLLVLGQDSQLSRWRRRFPELRFLGPVREPERVLPALDVMLLPTRYEPYGNACLEAMACGVVPVTTPQNGVSEVFPVPGLTGSSLEELLASVERALKGGDELKRRCREAAVALPRERAYAALEKLMLEMCPC
jgi:UDP-glucose:(heptosyl)LPS alpha-1,3-glucosyltransferase